MLPKDLLHLVGSYLDFDEIYTLQEQLPNYDYIVASKSRTLSYIEEYFYKGYAKYFDTSKLSTNLERTVILWVVGAFKRNRMIEKLEENRKYIEELTKTVITLESSSIM